MCVCLCFGWINEILVVFTVSVYLYSAQLELKSLLWTPLQNEAFNSKKRELFSCLALKNPVPPIVFDAYFNEHPSSCQRQTPIILFFTCVYCSVLRVKGLEKRFTFKHENTMQTKTELLSRTRIEQFTGRSL